MFIPYGHMPWSRVAEFYGNSVCNVSRYSQSVFLSDGTFYMPSNIVCQFQFLHILASACC